MFGSIRSPLSSLFGPSTAFASSSRNVLAPIARSPITPVQAQQVRCRANLAPKRTKYRKSMKGMPISLPTGGSIRGTVLCRGTYGLRLMGSARLSSAQLTACREAIKRKIKTVKGAEVFLRVFPDIPVCVKGNEVRMGKGKGSFEFWACRVPMGRVILEIGGGGIREEIAKAALRLAQDKLPVTSEIISISTPPRLGNITCSSLRPPPGAQVIPALLAEMDAKGEGGTVSAVLDREDQQVERLAKGLEGLGLGTTTPEARV